MHAELQQLIERGSLWKGNARPGSAGEQADVYVSSGQRVLDQALGGGWLCGRVHELQCAHLFSGELSLLAPCIAKAAALARPVFWLAPPAIPYAPALQGMLVQQASSVIEKGSSNRAAQHIVINPANAADALWAAETILHSGQVAVLLLWAEQLSATAVRRLHLAAAESDAWVFVLTGVQNEEARSYATRLRVHVEPAHGRDNVAHLANVQWQLLKRNGGWPIRLPRQSLPRWPSG